MELPEKGYLKLTTGMVRTIVTLQYLVDALK